MNRYAKGMSGCFVLCVLLEMLKLVKKSRNKQFFFKFSEVFY